MGRLHLGITGRITLLWTALFAAGLFAFALAATALVDREGREALDSDLLARAREARAAFAAGRIVSQNADPGVVVLLNGIVRSGTRSLPRVITTLPAGALGTGATVDGYRAVEIADPPYRVVAFVSDATVVEETGRIRFDFLLATLPILLVAALAGSFVARRSLRAVDEITHLAASIGDSGALGARVGRSSRDELGRLAATFDAMLARLEASFEREREFIGDVSHELRTAVGALTALAEVALAQEREPAAYRTALDGVVRRGRRLGTVIDDLLLLARADARALPATSHVDLGEIAASIAADAQRESSLALEVHITDEPLVVAATGELIGRALANLLSNALQHARARASLVVEPEDGVARATVDDDGPGVATAERERIFRRFYRGTARYDGSGIGLALALAVVRAYGGEIVIGENSFGGARFVVTLPLAR